MSLTDAKRNRMRVQFLMASSSATVANWMVRSDLYTGREKMQIFMLAKAYMRKRNDSRVYWEDMSFAIRQLRKEKKLK